MPHAEEMIGSTLVMMRKKSGARRLASQPKPHNSARKPQNDHTKELLFHARSFHVTAKKLAETLDFGSSPFAELDVSPVISLYHDALELYLTKLVDLGSRHLPWHPASYPAPSFAFDLF